MTRVALLSAPRTAAVLAAACALAGLYAATPARGAEEPAAGDDSCIACHRDPDFLVTHPRLYEYFRDWQRSIHQQEGVTCSDCHGGNPEATGREAAHAGMLGPDASGSAVYFSNVPATCGSCHDAVEEAYRTSAHFEHLTAAAGDGEAGAEKQGPSCVTCHRSMNTLTLDVTTVEETCGHCHDEDNHPEIPGEARRTLNKFLSIDRFYRYIAIRGKDMQARLFLEGIDDRREELSVLWHTFDLERIERKTVGILEDLQERRDAIRARARAADARTRDPDAASPTR